MDEMEQDTIGYVRARANHIPPADQALPNVQRHPGPSPRDRQRPRPIRSVAILEEASEAEFQQRSQRSENPEATNLANGLGRPQGV